MPDDECLRLSTQIVAAYLAHHAVPAEGVPGIIRSVYAALSGLAMPAVVITPEPAVPIRNSVFPDHIVCFEDGGKFKSLKRHLNDSYGMTPDEYRAKWGLPHDYPMVAPEYAASRSAQAKARGFGRRPPAPAEVPVQRIPAGVRGLKPGRKKSLPRQDSLALTGS
jgi:predicted transcriptional regulator